MKGSMLEGGKAAARFFSGERGMVPGLGHGRRNKNSSVGDCSSILSTNGSSQGFSFFEFDVASSAINNNDVSPSSPFRNYPWPPQPQVNRDCQDKDEDYWNNDDDQCKSPNVLMGSLVREEGHICSLATSGDLLYTGSDGKKIRVWKNRKEISGFRWNTGFVKAILISEDRIFTGHQDGKIRLWKLSSENPCIHKRVGTLPKFKDHVKSSMKPIKRNRSMVWLKKVDAISCLSLSEDKTLLYSASRGKSFKVWRISDSKCLETVAGHRDAVNSIVSGFDGLVFTGSEDGSIKVWRREMMGKGTKHFYSQTLLKQESAITTLAVNPEATVIYGGSSEGLVNFWERKMNLSHGGVLRGHTSAVLCLITAGSLVFSGSEDTGICVWRRLGRDHICLSLLSGHTGPVKCLAAEKDDTSQETTWILYSGSLDKSVKLWRVSENAPPVAWNGCANAMPISLPPARSSDCSRRKHTRY